jgi:flagellar basal body-associated protein FliL
MQKVLGILGIATKVMTFLIVTVIAGISLATSYIMFAPDDMPKPFRLQYSYGASTPGANGTVPEVVPTVAPTEVPLKPGDGIMFNMSTKIINLADPSGRKYIRLTVVLEFAPDNPEYKKMKAEEQTAYLTAFNAKVNALMPMMDDAVITMLSTKTYEQLYTADGKEKLREEVMKAIQDRVTDYKLISIYFTEFVVQ